jgi:hypothetical protein
VLSPKISEFGSGPDQRRATNTAITPKKQWVCLAFLLPEVFKFAKRNQISRFTQQNRGRAVPAVQIIDENGRQPRGSVSASGNRRHCRHTLILQTLSQP